MSDRQLRTAFVVSLLLHALLGFLVREAARLPDAATAPQPFEVAVLPSPEPPASESAPAPEGEMAPAPPRPDTQIVAPSDAPEAPPLRDTPYRSDRDSRAQEETVRRGDGGPTRPQAEAEPSRPEREERASGTRQRRDRPVRQPAPSLSDLFISPSEALADPALAEGDSEREEKRNDLAAVRRPDLLTGDPGTPDYLPQVRDGKFTLLNAKADRFAPFVRRVGLRVFHSFSSDFKRRIFAGMVPRGSETLQIEAVMTPDGRRMEVMLLGRQGNLAADRVLLAVLDDRIFFDRNPPSGAEAEDGRIHFLFSLDASVWMRNDPESGSPYPAAQWIFGAGLL